VYCIAVFSHFASRTSKCALSKLVSLKVHSRFLTQEILPALLVPKSIRRVITLAHFTHLAVSVTRGDLCYVLLVASSACFCVAFFLLVLTLLPSAALSMSNSDHVSSLKRKTMYLSADPQPFKIVKIL
jgi:hypothetical protein